MIYESSGQLVGPGRGSTENSTVLHPILYVCVEGSQGPREGLNNDNIARFPVAQRQAEGKPSIPNARAIVNVR